MRHLITLADLKSAEIERIFAITEDLKTKYESGLREPLLPGRVMALLFEKPSLRTRVSFEAGMTHLGGNSMFLGEEVGFGNRESIADFGRVLSEFVDVIVVRTRSHQKVIELAEFSSCSVINGLTDYDHPCQALADLYTLRELNGPLEGQTLTYIGDGNNVARSLARGCGKVGMHFRMAAPSGYHFDKPFLASLKKDVPALKMSVCEDPREAVSDTDAVYTDVWTSMGQEAEMEKRRNEFAAYQVNEELMKAAPGDAHFMHCLPARRGEEVTDAVMDGANSVVVQQAANRLHVQKGILAWLLALNGNFEMRHDGRAPHELRPVKIKRRYTRPTPGSVLFVAGRTTVLCTASVEEQVPPWMKGKGRGWVTAEYSMLPGSTSPRKTRDRGGKIDGRTTEIQRLIGRSLRAVTDLEALGERSITIDCDVIEADGGTRTASITGAFIALVDAVRSIKGLPDPKRSPLRDSVAAVSVGISSGQAVLDLDYAEDSSAEVDMNVVMTGSGQFVELQGTGEEATFNDQQLAAMLKLARTGIGQLIELQREALGKHWPF